MSIESMDPVSIFYSYAHEDIALRNELDKHLGMLKQLGLIQSWHDRDVHARTEWKREIDSRLHTADIILLLVSADFISSEYCYSIEMQEALKRHSAGETVVIPIILRPVEWRKTPLGALQVLPAEGKPVTSWSNHDEAFEEIAREIRRVVELLRQGIFIVSSPSDQAFVARLENDLETRGLRLWRNDMTQLQDTLDRDEAMRKAIRMASIVLLIASPSTLSSATVRYALELAAIYQRKQLVIWIAGDDWHTLVPKDWDHSPCFDACGEQYETALDEILAILKKRYSNSPHRPTLLHTPEIEVEPRNPYKGLHAFTEEDAGDFFGRERLIEKLIHKLEAFLVTEQNRAQNARLLAIIGPSGSGKSSVVRAGLLPELKRGRVLDSRKWIYLDPVVPGSDPIESLALSFAQKLPEKSLKAICEDLNDDSARGLHLLARVVAKPLETKVVLFIDQFEELFARMTNEKKREQVIRLLNTAISEPHGPVIVLLTLRADFYDRPMRYHELGQLIYNHHIAVFPMEIQDLRAAIKRPAALPDVRLTFEDDVVGDLLFEMREAALPLLQFTLDQLFQQRQGHLLTRQAYEKIGGVKGALIKQAEQTFEMLPSEEHRRLARGMFVRLIDLGVSEQDTTRRRARLSEFSLPDHDQNQLLQETREAFIEARLLTTKKLGETSTLEVSHEALIENWTRLSGWIREAREDIPLQQSLSKDVAGWERNGKSKARLYQGSRLKEARAWAKRNLPSEQELLFLRESTGHQQRSRLIWIIPFLVLLLVIPVSLWFRGNTPTFACASGRLMISGSSALLSLVQNLAQEYHAQCSEASFTISPSSSVSGLDDVESGRSNIGLSDIAVSPQLADLVDHPIAIAVFTLVLNSGVKGIANLTIQQIRGIYNGTITNWSQVGGPVLPIMVISRISTSSTRQVFERYVLDGPERLSLGLPYMEVDTTALVASTVASTSGAIGYTDVETAIRQGLHIVSIDGMEALPGEVENNHYPFWAVEHMYTKGLPPPNTLISAFLQYMDGDTARGVESSLFVVNFNDMTRDALAAHAR